ncbi:MAG: FGGY family carbohydrate kinase [Actinomycetota bacterium]|nr:FGGY family carbohydrate kinase [Actinomycetota bacterium]
MTTLGIDLGTGSVKAAIVDADGRVASRASHPYRARSPRPGWAEADPREWLAATRSVAESALSGLAQRPTAVGICGQMHGVVVVDDDLVPLRPAILWADTRAGEQAREMSDDLGTEVLARLGSPAVPGLAATTLAWLARHEPEVMGRARYVLQPKDWLRAMLGGDVATDPSDASGTLMADVASGTWSATVLDWLGLDPAMLPTIVGSGEPCGTVRLGGRDWPVVAGGADTACALAGLGLGAGGGFVAVGTGAQVVRVLPDATGDPTLRTHTLATAGPPGSGWYRLGAVQSAGLVLATVLEWLGASVDEASAALRDGVHADDPVFVPFLAGERTPFMQAGLRGAWHRQGLSTDRGALLRSVLEGVAQAVALAVDAVQEAGPALPDLVPLIGGGTHDPAFRQLLADATGLALVPAEAPDASVAGAGLLAAGRAAPPMRSDDAEAFTPRPAVAGLLRERRAAMVGYATGDLGNPATP